MNFNKVATLCSFLSKSYAPDMLKLLHSYQSVAASEAASRLDIHTRTAQDFLEALESFDILEKKEVYEGKRPYFRYVLKKKEISILINLDELFPERQAPNSALSKKIRERKNSGAKFTTARNGQYFSSIVVWIGAGRSSKERKINLTIAQGKFLFNLPFPGASFLSIEEIMEKSEVEEAFASEVLDIVSLLEELKIVEENKATDYTG